jgi:AraC family transcriptional regulator, arabinose operon regulatory protein
MSFSSKQRVNTGAYTTPFSNTGIEFFPPGVLPGHSGVVLHESGYLRHNRGWNFPNMFSPFWRLIYDFQRGHTIAFPGREVPLGPERIVLLPDHHRCDFCETRPAPTFWLHFSHPRRPVPRQPIPIELAPSRTEMDLIGDLRALFERRRGGENRERIFRLSIALLQVVLSRPEIRWLKEKPESLLQTVRFIEQHHAEPIYNPQLARLANMSTTGFVEEFRRCQGVTPARFIAQVRIRETCNLLSNTALSLDEIAEKTGFPNRAYLSRVFKRVTGESPAHFRRDHAVSIGNG